MRSRYRALCLGSASALAIAAWAFLAPGKALACSFESTTREGAPAVNVTCPADDPSAEPFQTSYGGDSNPQLYDGNGADLLSITGGTIATGGNPVRYYYSGDSFYQLDPSVGEVNLLGGNDIVVMSAGTIGGATDTINLNLGEGNNQFSSTGGTIFGSLISGDGDDTLVIGGTTQINGFVATNGGDDDVTVSGSANIAGTVGGDAVGLGDGNDRFTMTGGVLGAGLTTGSGDDTVNLSGGSIATYVNLGTGNDQISVTGTASVGGDILGDAGNDVIIVDGGSVAGFVSGNDGNDTVELRSGTIGTALAPSGVDLGPGADIFRMSGGTLYGSVFGLGGGNTYEIQGGTINGSVFAGSQSDTVTISGTANIGVDTGEGGTGTDSVGLEDGDDTFTMTGGTLQGSVSGGAGNDTMTVSGGTVESFMAGNDGDDTMTVNGGTIEDDVLGGAGNDTIAINGGNVQGDVNGNADADQITIADGAVGGVVSGGAGNDQINLTGGAIAGDVLGDDNPTDPGNDTIVLNGANVAGYIYAQGGNDTVTIISGTVGTVTAPTGVDLGDGTNIFQMTGGTVFGSVFGGANADTLTFNGGTQTGGVFTGAGDDTVNILAGVVGADGDPATAVQLGAGNDRINISGGTINLDVIADAGDDVVTMTAGRVQGGISGDDGNDEITFSGGEILDYISGDAGDDTIRMTGGSISGAGALPGFISGDDGNDSISVSGGTVAGGVSGGADDDTIAISGTAQIGVGVTGEAGNDVIEISGGTVQGSVYGDDDGTGTPVAPGGNDTISVSGGSIQGSVHGDDGNDAIAVSGGTINGDVIGDDGNDSVSVAGGTIDGGIEAEHVELHGGTITGNISGIGPNTLVIDNVGAIDPLNLSDGVVFSGTDANAQITDTDLAAGGSKSQNFIGFDNVAVDNSTLAFAPGSNQQIALLSLANGSTLFVNGNVGMTGTLNVASSTIDMIDGAADDVFTLGGLTLSGATIGLDLDQQTRQADQLVAGLFSASGNNVINVNLLGTPVFSGVTDIPVVVSSGGPVGGTFTIAGIPGTVGSLFDFEVVQGPAGGLFIRATPSNFGVATAPDSAVNGSIVDVAIDALYGVNRDALDADLYLANGTQRVALTPSFGVFASGQFAHADHDGYSVYNGVTRGTGPDFEAEDFSAAISLDFNAAKHFNFDNQYGLNLGLFAGYASTDVRLNPFLGFVDVGTGSNKSGMFGGYALFRQGTNYALVSASAFLGRSDIRNGILNTTGKYDTEGYAATASAGHIFMLGERTRFDLRGGILGVSFTGDGYTDSGGNQFGDSRISFGALQFAPGIYGDYMLSNDMIFSPYARVELQQRFGATNTTVIDTRRVEFDDADFSTALSAGFNLKMTQATTLSGEVRGKWSSDSSTIGGKLGLKVAF